MSMRRLLNPVVRSYLAAFAASLFVVAAMFSRAGGQDRRLPRPEYSSSSGAQTYVDLPLRKLKNKVSELEHLNASDNQEGLGLLLRNIASTIARTLPKLPNVMSEENVYRAQGESGMWAPIIVPGQGLPSQAYRYLIQSRRTADGQIRIEESRVASSNRSEGYEKSGGSPLAYGFANQWLLFSEPNQAEFRFRYLGEQSVGHKKTFAIAFAQIPEKVRVPAIFQKGGHNFTFYYQGVLWVEQSTFEIVRLRSDLLEPVKSAALDKMTTELRFNLVKIRGYEAEFWLPVELRISSEEGRLDTEELHLYSKFHLYQSTARIVPTQ